jgi:hypothetical protein
MVELRRERDRFWERIGASGLSCAANRIAEFKARLYTGSDDAPLGPERCFAIG